MNTKAEAFSSFLDKNQITVYQVKEWPDNELNTVTFGSNITVEGQQLPTLVLLDDTSFIVIRVLILNNALKMDNEMQLMYFANKLNRGYKPFKFYFDCDGALLMEVSWPTLGQSQEDFASLGDEIYGMLDLTIKFLEKNYRQWMKEIW